MQIVIATAFPWPVVELLTLTGYFSSGKKRLTSPESLAGSVFVGLAVCDLGLSEHMSRSVKR